jgi:3-methylcrotonyl-CoA carboxylase alpha subunit
MPGTIVRVLTRAGQHVSAHEPLVVMEAMKMEHVIEAPHAGTVREVLYDEGDMVPAGSPLVRLDEE